MWCQDQTPAATVIKATDFKNWIESFVFRPVLLLFVLVTFGRQMCANLQGKIFKLTLMNKSETMVSGEKYQKEVKTKTVSFNKR